VNADLFEEIQEERPYYRRAMEEFDFIAEYGRGYMSTFNAFPAKPKLSTRYAFPEEFRMTLTRLVQKRH
jgi:hypothetical protein